MHKTMKSYHTRAFSRFNSSTVQLFIFFQFCLKRAEDQRSKGDGDTVCPPAGETPRLSALQESDENWQISTINAPLIWDHRKLCSSRCKRSAAQVLKLSFPWCNEFCFNSQSVFQFPFNRAEALVVTKWRKTRHTHTTHTPLHTHLHVWSLKKAKFLYNCVIVGWKTAKADGGGVKPCSS